MIDFIGVVAGALWRPTGCKVELAGPTQKRFAAKVEALGCVVCREPYLIRRYTPERTRPGTAPITCTGQL